MFFSKLSWFYDDYEQQAPQKVRGFWKGMDPKISFYSDYGLQLSRTSKQKNAAIAFR